MVLILLIYTIDMSTILGVKFLALATETRTRIDAYVRDHERSLYALSPEGEPIAPPPTDERRADRRLPLSRNTDVKVQIPLNGDSAASSFIPINLSAGGFRLAYSGEHGFSEGDILAQIHVRSEAFEFVCTGIVVYVLTNGQ